jgi:hypothetical protein
VFYSIAKAEDIMNMKVLSIIWMSMAIFVACATADELNKKVPHTFEKKEPGPEFDFLGQISLGRYIVSGGSGKKIAASSAFAGLSEEHAIRKMKEMTLDAGGNYLIIDSIEKEQEADTIRYFGYGRAYKLRESYGKIGQLILSEKGHAVQFVFRMEPGTDYEPVRSVTTANGVKTGEKGEISGFAKSEEEAIILLRNMTSDVGGNLLVIDTVSKDEKNQIVQFEAKGRTFKLKKK